MLPLYKLVNIALLATVLFSPTAIAQQQSLTSETGSLEQKVPCTDKNGKPIRCPWVKGKPITSGDTSADKKPNPCNPKKDQPVDTKACRDYILGNPKPPTSPKP
ncbi:hypothetical protein [Brunnivagina elsteri]|uniref:Uncharacterized protein n=1 Tax=Brunnivagina elsteri CCALA 953 TaxID=987040 RepID=A0A2A2TG69_9CYAN|nr:hypothetical protein [Calothrix elsteri]PAX52638.1 hypothetical protein CK510_18230 [Calothrix elsteri CCALA 953]